MRSAADAAMAENGDGWHVVHAARANTLKMSVAQREDRDRKEIAKWAESHGHWSGHGQHLDPSKLKVAQELHRKIIILPELLGGGTYGRVEKVDYKSVCLARKHIKPRRRVTLEDIIKEAEVMKKLSHEHIVQLVGTYTLRSNDLYILIWPVAVCSLDALIRDLDDLRNDHGDPIDIETRLQTLGVGDLNLVMDRAEATHYVDNEACPFNFLQRILGCIAKAVAYCHSSNVRHLDLKPKNILLNPDRVYLADFGISKDTSGRDNTNTLNPFLGTRGWKAPEVQNISDEWSMQAADIYSLGLVYLDIFSILCRVQRHDFEDVFDEEDVKIRAEKLTTYQDRLAREALATQRYEDEKAATLNPKHILGLTTKMLSQASKRPRAEQVDRELARLGGLDQIYHSRCCRKRSRGLREYFNGLFAEASDERDRLQQEVGGLRKRVETLKAAEETYTERVKREQENSSRAMEILRRQLEKEKERSKALEEQVAELTKVNNRRGPRPAAAPKAERTGTPIGQGLYNSNDGLCLTTHNRKPSNSSTSAAIQRNPTRHSPMPTRQPGRPVGARIVSDGAIPPKANSPIPPSPTPAVGGYPLRSSGSGSRLPLPANPATPIRSGTPVTPILSRDATDSTQFSLTSSTFSIRSQETNPTPMNGSPSFKQSPFQRGSITRPTPVAIPAEPSSPTASLPSAPPTVPSATSSPRTARSELTRWEDDNSRGEMLASAAVPSFQPAKSWAAVAGDTQGLAKMIESIPKKPKAAGVHRRPQRAEKK